ncbi:hypothetical protein BOO91_05015 [Vibrio navarrensis]|nr:hypothetical protein [Vibrio navarrensis]MBE3660305.1 hypothetical protein [Vibrio navarrensis]
MMSVQVAFNKIHQPNGTGETGWRLVCLNKKEVKRDSATAGVHFVASNAIEFASTSRILAPSGE